MSKICLMCGETFPDSTTFCPRDGSALRAAVQGDDLIGELFCDRYVVTDLLGEGGMGSVYVARDVRLPQQVAIKVLRDKTATDPVTVSRFRQEAEAASRINHDRVARVSDFGFMTDGRAYLVMEYVSGRTLKQTLEERGLLPPIEVAHITSMVAEGLDAAHRLGIVHRDLKPENVMVVDDAGGGTRVKVLDFGIAKVLAGEETNRTAPGFVIGTPSWMSPEQILGETLDSRSDVFALGLLAYAMLTGQRAFAGGTEAAEMMARLTSAPRTLEEAVPGTIWPAGLQALLNRTLSREVETRPPGALAFARELTKVISDGTVTAPTPPLPPLAVAGSVPATTDRRVRQFAIGGSALLALSLVAMIVVWQSRNNTKTSGAAKASAMRDSSAVHDSSPMRNSSAVHDSSAMRDTLRKAATAVKNPLPPTVVAKSNGFASKASADAPKNAAVQLPPGTGVENASARTAADELQRVMQSADSADGTDESNVKRAKVREIIRRLDELSPKLTSGTDRGWAAFYIGTSQATLGDNDKACAAIKQAFSLSGQSPVLRKNSEHWQHEILNCSR